LTHRVAIALTAAWTGISLRLRHSRSKPAQNHLGDCNEFLPTVHGFDEYFGNLYHLNVEALFVELGNVR
jgi:hypothetical protein